MLKEKKDSGLPKTTIVIVVITSIACLSLLGYDIWNTKYFNTELLEKIKLDGLKLNQIKAYINVSLTDPLRVFKRFFTSPEERARVSIKYEKHRGVNRTTRKATSACSFKCVVGQRRRRDAPWQPLVTRGKREATQTNAIHHGCCTSERMHVSPTTAKNLDGITRNIVQLDNDKQFFMTETCTQQTGCSGCTCGQPDDFVYEAVVYIGNTSNNDATNMEIDHIMMKGCCKCLNL